MDIVGNRTNRASTLAGITNQVFSYNTNDGLTIDAYDAAGNTRTNSGNVFLYDWANRLTNAVIGATNVAIVYNGDGQRVKKTVIVGTTTNTTLYLVDEHNPTGYAQVLEEKSVVGTTTNLVKAFVYGLDLINQRIPNVTTNFYGCDGIGSTRFLLNLAGSVSDTYVFDAFGTVITSTGTTTNDCLFQGEWRDAHLGLAYHRDRYLSFGLGRWWTMDRWPGNNREPQSLHKYVGFHNSPVVHTDPSGLEVHQAARDLDTVATLGLGTHHFIIMIPDNPADFQGTGPGVAALNATGQGMRNIGGRQMIVVGVHNLQGRARVRYFQEADVLATRELYDPNYQVPFYRSDFDAEAHLIPPPQGRNDTTFIIDILQATQNYILNEDNTNIPYPPAGGGFTPLFQKAIQ